VTVGDYIDFAHGVVVDTVGRTIDLSAANPVPEADMYRVTFRSATGASWQVYVKPGESFVPMPDPTAFVSSVSGLAYEDVLATGFSVAAIDLGGTLDWEAVVALDGDDLNRLTELTDAFSVIQVE